MLLEGLVLCHSFVIGELACGHLKNRAEVLSLLQNLPAAPRAEEKEVLHLIELRRLSGAGIGWVDAHLLASSMLANAPLWTEDAGLRRAAARLGILYPREFH